MTEKNRGWISIYRKYQEHWLYPTNEERRFTRSEAWIDLLLLVSHKEIKNVLQGRLTTIPREVARWKWHRNSVKMFLHLLKKKV